jgi:hypothetical protein
MRFPGFHAGYLVAGLRKPVCSQIAAQQVKEFLPHSYRESEFGATLKQQSQTLVGVRYLLL